MLNYEAFCLSQVSAFSAPKKKMYFGKHFKMVPGSLQKAISISFN